MLVSKKLTIKVVHPELIRQPEQKQSGSRIESVMMSINNSYDQETAFRCT